MANKISLIVPVYNEENSIGPFLKRTLKVLRSLVGDSYEIIFCLDPSDDNTFEVIKNYCLKNKKIKLITFSRRFGQPSATIAGLSNCTGDFIVVIDVDLQDPPEIIANLYGKILEGYDVVNAKRIKRKGETIFKLLTTKIGYYIINKISDVNIPESVGDFRIFNKKVLHYILQLKEKHGFLRGLVAFVGFNQTYFEYCRDERYLDDGKYNKFFGSIKIGLNGIIGFSSKPLFLMSISGFIFAFMSFFLGIWYLLQKILGLGITPGLSTTVILITFFSGIQLIGIGLLGEYIGRIYDEVKERPLFIIDKKINLK